MTEVPGSDWSEVQPDMQPPFDAKWKKRPGIVEHTFTHFHLEVTVWVAEDVEIQHPDDSYRWVPLQDVAAEALPTIMRKIVAHAVGS